MSRPEIGLHKSVKMNRGKRYNLDLKHEICRLYISGGFTKDQLQDRYGIKGKTTLLMWLRKLDYITKSKEQPKNTLLPLAIEDSKEVKALKSKLFDAELKAEAYQRMISIAEKKYKIDIRKKSGTK